MDYEVPKDITQLIELAITYMKDGDFDAAARRLTTASIYASSYSTDKQENPIAFTKKHGVSFEDGCNAAKAKGQNDG